MGEIYRTEWCERKKSEAKQGQRVGVAGFEHPIFYGKVPEIQGKQGKGEVFDLNNIKTASAKSWFASAWFLERKHPERSSSRSVKYWVMARARILNPDEKEFFFQKKYYFC